MKLRAEPIPRRLNIPPPRSWCPAEPRGPRELNGFMSTSPEQFNGALLINKPKGMTSHDVVDRVRRIARTRRVGHAGTLDPMAEGLLVVCVGPATRIMQFLTGLTKDYSGSIRLGACSSTYDAEGEIVPQSAAPPDSAEMVAEAMSRQMGWRAQLPPPYSAIKVNGKKLYEYARRGEVVPQKPRRVRIMRFDLIRYVSPDLEFFARVGSGTYIRSMAHDLGADLGCGGHLIQLTRDRVGHFELREATTLAELIEYPELIGRALLDIPTALRHLPRITVSERVERDVLNGRGFGTADIQFCDELPRAREETLVVSESGRALSVVRGETFGPRLVAEDSETEGLEGAGAESYEASGADAGANLGEDAMETHAEPHAEPDAETYADGEPMPARGGELFFRPIRVLGRDVD